MKSYVPHVLVDTLFLVQLRDPGLPPNLVFAVYLWVFSYRISNNLYLNISNSVAVGDALIFFTITRDIISIESSLT